MPQTKQKAEHCLISPELRLHLNKTIARLDEFGHPAALAGCFAHWRTGDAVWPNQYRPIAERASFDDKFQDSPTRGGNILISAFEPPRESLAEVSLMAVAQKKKGSGALVAFLRERELLAAAAMATGRKMARLRLPVILVTFSRTMPQPGDNQKRIGIPEISVAAEDAIAVYRVAEESFWRARTGVGPTWMRCVTG